MGALMEGTGATIYTISIQLSNLLLSELLPVFDSHRLIDIS